MLGKKYKAKTNCSLITHNLNRDLFWMGQTIELARQAGEKDEVPVAAMLVKEDTLIAEAHNLREQHGNPYRSRRNACDTSSCRKNRELAIR